MTKYALAMDYEYTNPDDSTEERLTVWCGPFASDYVGEAYIYESTTYAQYHTNNDLGPYMMYVYPEYAEPFGFAVPGPWEAHYIAISNILNERMNP